MTPSPQSGVHGWPGVGQSHPVSIVQAVEQPSPPSVPPSSHASFTISPFPQREAGTLEDEEDEDEEDEDEEDEDEEDEEESDEDSATAPHDNAFVSVSMTETVLALVFNTYTFVPTTAISTGTTLVVIVFITA